MATVSKENMVFTVMVRHTVEPKHQKELVNLFKRMLPVFQKQPGLVSLNVHRSLDGTQVLTYLQWRSEELITRHVELVPKWLQPGASLRNSSSQVGLPLKFKLTKLFASSETP